MGAMLGLSAFPKKAMSRASHARKSAGIETTEGVRDRVTVSLSPAIPKHLPVTKVATTGAFSDALEANEASSRIGDRRGGAFEAKKNVRGGTDSYDNGSSSVQRAVGRRSPGTRKRLSERRIEAGPPKLAQANSSVMTRRMIRAARTASDPERSSPHPLMHEMARTKDHSCGPHLRI